MSEKIRIVRKNGNSNYIGIPMKICKALGIVPGNVMAIKQKENGIMITPLEVRPKQ